MGTRILCKSRKTFMDIKYCIYDKVSSEEEMGKLKTMESMNIISI